MKKNKKVTVRISRAKWSRGHDGNSLRLAYSKVKETGNKSAKRGNMCCLGFACLALGANKKEITDHGLPSCVEKLLPGLTEKYVNPYASVPAEITDTKFSQDAADINDSQKYTDREREKKLRKLAYKAGFKFMFVA